MLAVIHLNWLVQQRAERPICSFLPLWHNVRCHSARGPQLGSPVTDDRYPRSLLPWNLFTKLQSFPLYCIFTLKSGGGQKGTKGTGKWKKQKFNNSWDSSVVCACFWEAMMIIIKLCFLRNSLSQPLYHCRGGSWSVLKKTLCINQNIRPPLKFIDVQFSLTFCPDTSTF